MRRTFHNELKDLKSDIIKMGSLVEDNVQKSVRSLASGNKKLAKEVVERQRDIHDYTLMIEERSTNMIATQCPVARDLRLIHSIMYISFHLERAGNLSSNVAKMTTKVSDVPISDFVVSVEEMGEQAAKIVHLSIESFKNGDIKQARNLPKIDEPIDNSFKSFFKQLNKFCGNEKVIDAASNIILAARYIERIADHAVDIGQRVIYMVTGQIEEFE